MNSRPEAGFRGERRLSALSGRDIALTTAAVTPDSGTRTLHESIVQDLFTDSADDAIQPHHSITV